MKNDIFEKVPKRHSRQENWPLFSGSGLNLAGSSCTGKPWREDEHGEAKNDEDAQRSHLLLTNSLEEVRFKFRRTDPHAWSTKMSLIRKQLNYSSRIVQISRTFLLSLQVLRKKTNTCYNTSNCVLSTPN